MFFSLFNEKIKLIDLIPDGFIDIHSHILPSIDDGPKSLNESIELIEKMNNAGINKIIATPHIYPGTFNNNKKIIKTSFNKIKFMQGEKLKLDYAAEYLIDHYLIELANENKILTITKNYILVEFSYLFKFKKYHEVIFALKTNDYIPILAHPERYSFISNQEFFELKKIGCLFQTNLLSFSDYYGIQTKKKAEFLIKNNLIDFIATDFHRINQIKFAEKSVSIDKKNLLSLSEIMGNNRKIFK